MNGKDGGKARLVAKVKEIRHPRKCILRDGTRTCLTVDFS